MNKEIKEILNRFDFVKKEPNKLSYYPEDLLTREEMWLLYDCITNLQKTQETLIKNDNEIITNLQEEISHLRQNKARTLEYIENNRIREKCIVDVNTLEGLLNE